MRTKTIAKSVTKTIKQLQTFLEKLNVLLASEKKLTKAESGRKGGLKRSAKKTLASRQNGKLGGRPKK